MVLSVLLILHHWKCVSLVLIRRTIFDLLLVFFFHLNYFCLIKHSFLRNKKENDPTFHVELDGVSEKAKAFFSGASFVTPEKRQEDKVDEVSKATL